MIKNPENSRIPVRHLVAVFFLGITILGTAQFLERSIAKPDHHMMIKAAAQTAGAFQVIGAFCARAGINIDRVMDPNLTGLIGEEFTPITTTLGNLSAKQTSLNPDFAAFILETLKSHNFQIGDRIAIQASASFPALTIAAIIACETVGLKPVVSVSLGASSFGANRAELTYLDLESELIRKGLIRSRSVLVTPGGENDNGSSYFDGGLEIVQTAARRNGYDLYIPQDLEASINLKWDLFEAQNGVKFFINIGGNQSAIDGGRWPSGLISPNENKGSTGNNGLISKFLAVNIPVLNLLGIRDLAVRNNIILSPYPLPEAGVGMVYYQNDIPGVYWLIGLLFMAAGFIYLGFKREY